MALLISTDRHTVVSYDKTPETFLLEFKTIGDHSMLGLIQLRDLRERIKNKHVNVKAAECWYACFKDNMDYLLSLKPKSVTIEIYKFI